MKYSFLDQFISKLLEMKTQQEMKVFLETFLSPKELEEIPTRYQIILMLKNGVPQREIAKKLEVGIATVTRGSKELQKESTEK